MPYDLTQIRTISSAQGMRQRPKMYLGDPAQHGLANRLLEESLCISLDALQMGAARKLEVQFFEDGSVRVSDDSSGLDMTRDESDIPFPQRLMTELYACSHEKSDETRHFCDIGIVCTNVFSTWLHLEIFQAGIHWSQRYVEGEPQAPFENIGFTDRTGNQLHFKPDPSILSSSNFDQDGFYDWFSQLQIPNTRVEIDSVHARVALVVTI